MNTMPLRLFSFKRTANVLLGMLAVLAILGVLAVTGNLGGNGTYQKSAALAEAIKPANNYLPKEGPLSVFGSLGMIATFSCNDDKGTPLVTLTLWNWGKRRLWEHIDFAQSQSYANARNCDEIKSYKAFVRDLVTQIFKQKSFSELKGLFNEKLVPDFIEWLIGVL